MITINSNEIIHATGSPSLVWEKLLRNHNLITRFNEPKKGFNGEDIWTEGDRNQHIQVRHNNRIITLTPNNREAYIKCFQMLNYLHTPEEFYVRMYDKDVAINGKQGYIEAKVDKVEYVERDVVELLLFAENSICKNCINKL